MYLLRMPQWNADRARIGEKYRDERVTLSCSRGDAEDFLRYDHHVVWIGDRPALILTYHWNEKPLKEFGEPLEFYLSFTYAPGHPAAPNTIQQKVSRLASHKEVE